MQSSRSDRVSRLWVCWREPTAIPDFADCILTFLLPSIEQRLKLKHPGEVLFGREVSLPIRKQARADYLSISARMAAVPLANGKTLRQRFADSGECSRWWYHRASFKDCEADPIFNRMIALFTILKIAEERNIRDIVLVGAPAEFAVALKTAFRVRSLSESAFGLASACARSLTSRFAFGLKTVYECWLARR